MATGATNKKCPVCDYAVDASAKTVTVAGRSVRVCCEDCEKKLRGDPKKYLAAK